MLDQAAKQSTDWSAIIGLGTAIFGLIVAADQARRALGHKQARVKTHRRMRVWRKRARRFQAQARLWRYIVRQRHYGVM